MESYTSISLVVPKTFSLPKSFQTASPEQLQHVLELADLLLETGLHYKDDSEKQHLRQQIHQLQSTTVESVRDEAVRIARSELRVEVSGKDALIQELKQQLDHMKHSFEDLKLEKNHLNAKLTTKEEKIDLLQEKLQQRIAIQSNSSKRGQEGEKDFKALTSNIKSWILESVGKTKESTDFRSLIHTLEVRFEVKNHETEVPYAKNVDKFERDMKTHPNTKVGIFVALTAKIEKLDDSITVRWTEDKQLLVFIPYFLTRDLAYTYDVIESFIRTMKYLRPFLETKDTNKDIELLTEKITNSIMTIQLVDKQITEMLKDHQEYNVKTLARYKALQSLVLSSLSVLTGKEQEEIKPKARGRQKKKHIEESSE
jgi:hypothetical protein